MRIASSSSLSILMALVLAACGGEMTTDAGTDAGRLDDAGGGDAGTDAGRDAGMDGGGGTDAGEDAGTSDFDAGMIGACNAGTVTLEDMCPAFVPCGGTPDGAWCYSNVCIEITDLFGTMIALCPNLVVNLTTGSVVGRIEFTGGTQVSRQVNTHLEATVMVPAFCLLTGLTCADIEDLANDQLGADGTATCAMSGTGGCNCDVTFDASVDSTSSYTVAGNMLMSGGRTYDFCAAVDGSSFTFQETGMNAEPGIQSTIPE